MENQSSDVVIHLNLSTKMVCAPKLATWAAKLWLRPWMMATMAMTVITPMTMPMVVRKVRRRCAMSDVTAMRMLSPTSPQRRQSFMCPPPG